MKSQATRYIIALITLTTLTTVGCAEADVEDLYDPCTGQHVGTVDVDTGDVTGVSDSAVVASSSAAALAMGDALAHCLRSAERPYL